MEDPDESTILTVDGLGERTAYLNHLKQFRDRYREDCARAGIDYVPMDTSINFDKALMEYLLRRQRRG
jgi:hypothetical protein